MTKRKAHLLTAALLSVFLLPLIATIVGTDGLSARVDYHPERSRIIRQQRAFHRAMTDWQKAQKRGIEGVEKPVVNDPSTWGKWGEGFEKSEQRLKRSAPVEQDEKVVQAHRNRRRMTQRGFHSSKVNESDRRLLRTYTRAGRCTLSLKNTNPSLFWLCREILRLDKATEPVQGLKNELQTRKEKNAVKKATLKDRYSQTRQRLRRAAPPAPLRPTKSNLEAAGERS